MNKQFRQDDKYSSHILYYIHKGVLGIFYAYNAMRLKRIGW